MQNAVGLRLGCKIVRNHQCRCGQTCDELGHHDLSCRFSAGRHSRHHEVNSIIQRALGSSHVPSVLEPSEFSENFRPDGASLVPWAKGKFLLWDYTCSDTLAASYREKAVSCSGNVAKAAEERKRIKYASLCQQYIFVPVGSETLGAWGPEAKSFFRKVGDRLVEESNDKRARVFLMQRLSMAIQRGNSASIMGSLPTGHQLDELFDL